jgi:hypothetical protein
MDQAVGRELFRRSSYPIADADVRRWMLAVYWPEPPPAPMLDAGSESFRVPEEFNPFGWLAAYVSDPEAFGNQNDPDHTERVLDLDRMGFKNVINGGVSVSYGVPMRVGDVVTSTYSLGGYSEREGRFGAMLYTVLVDRWTNLQDELIKTQRITLVRY